MGADEEDGREVDEVLELPEELVDREEVVPLEEAVEPEAMVVPRVPCMITVTPGEVVGSRRVATEAVNVPLSLITMLGAPEEALGESAVKKLSVNGLFVPKGSPSVHRVRT